MRSKSRPACRDSPLPPPEGIDMIRTIVSIAEPHGGLDNHPIVDTRLSPSDGCVELIGQRHSIVSLIAGVGGFRGDGGEFPRAAKEW